jgi:hypothetical protein
MQENRYLEQLVWFSYGLWLGLPAALALAMLIYAGIEGMTVDTYANIHMIAVFSWRFIGAQIILCIAPVAHATALIAGLAWLHSIKVSKETWGLFALSQLAMLSTYTLVMRVARYYFLVIAMPVTWISVSFIIIMSKTMFRTRLRDKVFVLLGCMWVTGSFTSMTLASDEYMVGVCVGVNILGVCLLTSGTLAERRIHKRQEDMQRKSLFVPATYVYPPNR